ncbi:MAG: UDP-3-O-(3-hydroxymyristoyl)glucosamine N-acyltransferase [Chitinophagales bacterium]
MVNTAADIATMVGGEIVGDDRREVREFSRIQEGAEGALSFVANPKYEKYLGSTKASVVLVQKDLTLPDRKDVTFIKVDDSYQALQSILSNLSDGLQLRRGVEPSSFVHENAQVDPTAYIAAFAYVDAGVVVGPDVQVFPHCFIGEGSVVGAGTVLHSGVKIYRNTRIGDRCILHAGCVIGSDGFGFVPQQDGSFQKMPHIGNVLIGNDVEVGANTTIDRGSIGDSILKDGVKVDNLVHIAHNVEIDNHSAIAAQVGISGSTRIGKSVLIGGQVGIVGHITIADGVQINAQSGVSKSIDVKGQRLTGSPARPFREHYKMMATLRKLTQSQNK